MSKKTLALAALFSFFASFAHAFDSYFSPETDLDKIFVTHFLEAKSSIDLVIYTFQAVPVRDALIDRLKHGVKVRVLINEGDTANVAAFVKPLQDAGASVRWVTPILHHKFAVIDGKRLINSSGNLAGSALSHTYDENLVTCDDCSDYVTAYASEFKALSAVSNLVGLPNDVTGLAKGQAGKPVHQNFEGTALFTSSNYLPKYDTKKNQLTVTTDDLEGGVGRVDSVLANAINGARSEVLVASGHFRSKPLYDALAKAAQRGVRVAVVSDGQEYVSPMAQTKQDEKLKACMVKHTEVDCSKTGLMFSRLLAKAGVEMYLKYYMFIWDFINAPQMHHKYMIVDGQTLYSGSYNFSHNAEYDSFENVAVYEGPGAKDLIASYQKNFESLLNYGGGSKSFDTYLEKFRTSKKPVSLSFAPITLRLEQVDQLVDTAVARCPNLFKLPSGATSCRP